MSRVKVDDYGDILALKYDGEKVYYSTEGGSYQGEYVAVVKCLKEIGYGDDKLEQYYVFVDSYGSCSGCDWLESEQDYDNNEVDAAKALEYAEQSKPLYILPELPTEQWVNALSTKVNY